MATYVAEALQRTRSQVRWNYTRGNIWPGPAPVPPIEPLTETTMAALKKSLRAEPAEIPKDAPPRAPTVFGPSRHLQAQLVQGGGVNCISWPTSQTPYEIAAISVSAAHPAVLAGPHFVALYLYATADDRTGAPAQPTEPLLFPNAGLPGGLLPSILELGIGNQNSAFLTPHIPVDRPDQFLTAWILPAGIPFIQVSLGITLTEIDVQRLIIRPLIISPQVLTRSISAAPLPAGRPSSLPRGLKVSVMVANRPIYSRDIAWASADPELKKQFLNAQLSGNYPPTLQPIW